MTIKQLIFDLDGTVYLDAQPIGDVIAEINQLKKRGRQFWVLTNNTSIAKQSYWVKLQKMGMEIQAEQIVSPLEVAANYLKRHFSGADGYWLCTEDFEKEMRDSFDLKNSNSQGAAYVLLTFDRSLTYAKLEKAAHLIQQGKPYFLSNIDLTCPTRLGPIPDCGLMAEMLEKTTGVKAKDHFGKPGSHMAAYLLKKMGGKTSEALLAGDRTYTDIALGQAMSIQTLLVFSGESSPKSYQTYLDQGAQPATYTSATLADFLKKLDSLK